jgi:hypothetical protein
VGRRRAPTWEFKSTFVKLGLPPWNPAKGDFASRFLKRSFHKEAAMPAWEALDQTLANVKKILGDDAQIPLEKKAAVNKTLHELNAAIDAMRVKRKERIKKIFDIIDDLERKLGEYQNANSKIGNALDLAEAALTASTYRLKINDPEENKKIGLARLLFKNYFKDRDRKMADQIKNGSDYDKQLEQLKNALAAAK